LNFEILAKIEEKEFLPMAYKDLIKVKKIQKYLMLVYLFYSIKHFYLVFNKFYASGVKMIIMEGSHRK
jgi:hypothetical protein